MPNYIKIFKDNLLLGANIGQAVIVSCILTKPLILYKYPLANRVLEVGLYNLIQNEYFSPIPFSNFNNYIDNSAYKGTFQSVKWLPNLWIQNYVKEEIPNYNFLLKAFIIPLCGMTPFFTIGAIEDKIIKDHTNKIVFTLSSAAILATIPAFYSVMQTIKTNNGAILLSHQDSLLTQVGLVGSYFFMDLAHILKIPETFKNVISLPSLTIVSMAINEGYNLATSPNLTIADSANNIAFDLMRIGAFSAAKAIGVTATTFAYYNPALSIIIGLAGYKIIAEQASIEETLNDPLIGISIGFGIDYLL